MDRGEARPASDDYALYADELKNRGKLLPCPGCGDAPDHVEDDAKCVANRAAAVRLKQIKLERLEEIRQLQERLPDAPLTEEEEETMRKTLKELMVD